MTQLQNKIVVNNFLSNHWLLIYIILKNSQVCLSKHEIFEIQEILGKSCFIISFENLFDRRLTFFYQRMSIQEYCIVNITYQLTLL